MSHKNINCLSVFHNSAHSPHLNKTGVQFFQTFTRAKTGYQSRLTTKWSVHTSSALDHGEGTKKGTNKQLMSMIKDYAIRNQLQRPFRNSQLKQPCCRRKDGEDDEHTRFTMALYSACSNNEDEGLSIQVV
jgi:hypothetical protein